MEAATAVLDRISKGMASQHLRFRMELLEGPLLEPPLSDPLLSDPNDHYFGGLDQGGRGLSLL